MRTATLRDRLDGLTNPLLIKEMYQSLHSKKFLMALWLMLGCSLLTYVIAYQGSRGEACGEGMFAVFMVILYLAGVCVLPFLAFSTLNEEMKSRTVELVHITRMNARKHVRGRWLASAVKVTLLFSIMGPFAVAAFLFKGIGVVDILVTLALIYLISLSMCTTAIFFASLTAVRELRSLARLFFYLGLLGMVLMAFSTLFAFLQAMRYGMSSGGWGEMLLGIGFFALQAIFGMWFVGAASANILTFEADKCSARTKFILLLWTVLEAACLWLMALTVEPMSREMAAMFLVSASWPVLIFGSFWITGPNRVAQRVRKRLERRGPVYKALMFPFVDGLGSSAAYIVVAAAVIFVVAGLMLLSAGGGLGHRSSEMSSWFLVATVAYIFFFSALARGVVRLLPEKRHTAKWVRGMFLAIIGLNLIITILWMVSTDTRITQYESSPLIGLFPIIHMVRWGESLNDMSDLPELIIELCLPALIGIVYHVTAVLRHFRRYMCGVYN